MKKAPPEGMQFSQFLRFFLKFPSQLNNNLTNLIQFYWNGTGYKYPLQIRFDGAVCNNGTNTTVTYTAFPHGLLKTIAFCNHVGFSAQSTISISAESNGSATLYQYNSDGAAMAVGYIAIGY